MRALQKYVLYVDEGADHARIHRISCTITETEKKKHSPIIGGVTAHTLGKKLNLSCVV